MADALVDEVPETLPPPDPLPALPAYQGRIVVTPAAVLFTRQGDHTMLRAEVFDASGRPVSATGFTWESSRPEMVNVDAGGQVTATAALGSSQIRVRAGGFVSPPVTVLVAEPATGAVLVTDAQILAGPTPMDPDAASDVGSKVVVSVTGVPTLEPGTVLLASEGKSVAGRVVTATPVAGEDQLDVVLELIPLYDLFERLHVESSYDIDPAAMAEALATSAPASKSSRPQTLPDRPLGPFDCKFKASVGAITGTGSVDLRPDMKLDFVLSKDGVWGDWQEIMFKLEGSVTVTGSLGLTFSPGSVFSLSCEKVVARIPIPVNGAMSALVRLEVPISIEGEITATLALTTFKAGLELRGENKIAVGFQYTPQGGTKNLGSSTNKMELKPTYTVPDVPGSAPGEAGSNALITVAVSLGAGVGLNVSSLVGWLSLLKASLMIKAEAKVGGKIKGGLWFNTAYDLKPTIKAGAGSDVKKALSWFGGLAKLDPSITLTLPVISQSPRGPLTADKMRVNPMQPVTLSVDLDPETLTFVGIDNVVDVRFYRNNQTDVGFELLETVPGSPRRTKYTYTYTPTFKDGAAGSVLFWAGVTTRFLPFLNLEVNPMSLLTVRVGEGGTLWKGSVTTTCSEARTNPDNHDTLTSSLSSTIQTEHETEADAVMGKVKVTATAVYTEKSTHDYKAEVSPDCPVDVHEETNISATVFQPIVFATRFDDSSGSFAATGAAYLMGTSQFTHIEKGPCNPEGTTRVDPPHPFTTSLGYNIYEMGAPDATSFSGSTHDGDAEEMCDQMWSFERL